MLFFKISVDTPFPYEMSSKISNWFWSPIECNMGIVSIMKKIKP